MSKSLKKLQDKNLANVAKYCQPEFLIWNENTGKSIELALDFYFNFTIHLLCELAEERKKLERLNKK